MREVEFRVGDKVWDVRHGNGIIEYIKDGRLCLVGVEFQDGSGLTYTLDGKVSSLDKRRSLFHGHDLTVNEKLPVRGTKLEDMKVGEMWVDLHGFEFITLRFYNDKVIAYNRQYELVFSLDENEIRDWKLVKDIE
jgi:hypothetical protein